MRAIVAAGRHYWGIMSCILVVAAIAGTARATASAADEPGAWQSHHLQFYYMAFGSTYSCEGLETDLQGLLKQSGARQIAVTVGGPCGTQEKLMLARLEFSTLRPIASGGDNGGQTVAGSWHRVMISPKYLLLQGGSCQLVQEFQSKVLPLFATRNVSANLDCIPFQSTGYLFSLNFDVFAPSNAKLPNSPNVP